MGFPQASLRLGKAAASCTHSKASLRRLAGQSVFDLSDCIATRGEEVCAFAWGDSIQQFPDFLPQGFNVSLGGFAESSLEFGKELFCRVQIRRVRGQKEYDGSRRDDRILNSRHLVTAEVVEDYGVSGLERWAQELTHISQKHLAPGGDQRCGQLLAPQSAHKGRRLPMPMGRRVEAALTPGLTPVAARHAGRGPCFIDKHELFDFHRGLRLLPRSARLLHGLSFLLAGVQRFC